jgi:hypothetical protein
MKVLRPLSLYWLILAALLVWALVLHGQQFGGIKYLGHVGRGWSAALQGALILCSVLLALALSKYSSNTRAVSGVVLLLSALFILSLFGGFIPVLGQLLAFLSPYAYSPVGSAVHGVVFLSAIGTYLSQAGGPSAA